MSTIGETRARIIEHGHQDGHAIALLGVDAELYPRWDVLCTTPELCEAKWSNVNEDGTPLDPALPEAWPCWLRYWIREDDSWNECVYGRADGVGPYPIAWRWDGDSLEIALIPQVPS